MAGAASKLHVNGGFSEGFEAGKGVRQGCPLSHLLFALATQPLLDFLRFQLSTGNLHRLPIVGDLIVCYHLFADDMGMFILANEVASREARMAIALYELAFGVRLNLAKLIVIPFGVLDILL